jgi:hypothetical protein
VRAEWTTVREAAVAWVDLAVGNGCDLQKRQSHEMAAVAGMRLREDSGAESVWPFGDRDDT